MARYEMPAEFIARLQGAFEVDGAAWFPGPQGSARQRLVRHVECEGGPLPICAHGSHREADPIAGDGRTQFDRIGVVVRTDCEAPALASDDFADVGDDAREHAGFRISAAEHLQVAPRALRQGREPKATSYRHLPTGA